MVFELFQKLHLIIYACKCGKKGKKLQKFDYLENENTFLDEIKSIFHSFWRAIFSEQIKIYTSLKYVSPFVNILHERAKILGSNYYPES